MKDSSAYWLVAYIVSVVAIVTITAAYIVHRAPDKLCRPNEVSPSGVEDGGPRVIPSGRAAAANVLFAGRQ